MRNKLKLFLPVFFLLLFVIEANAAKRYWVGGTSQSWNTSANWSTSSGGAGGAGVPGSSDTAYFDGAAVTNHRCNVDATVNIKRLDISGDTLSQGANTITIGSSGATCSGGVFIGGSSNITVSGAFTISGCTFTSTSATFSTSANLTISSGTFSHNNGTVAMTATSTLSISKTGGVTFYDLTFAPTAANSTFTITSTTTITVSDILSYGGTKSITLNSGTIDISGNISTASNSQTGGGGTATLNINGSGSQTLTGNSTIEAGALPKITVNKSSDTLHLASKITIANDWTSTSGAILAGTSTVAFILTSAITIANTGGTTFYDLTFDPIATTTITLTSTTNFTVSHKFLYGGVYQLTFNSGTLNVTGDIAITNTQAYFPGTSQIVINGSNNQTFTGSPTSSYAHFPSITINKSSDTLFLVNVISVEGDWTYTSGVVSPGTSTVEFYNVGTIKGSMSFNNLQFIAPTVTGKDSIPSGTILTVDGTLSTSGVYPIILNTGSIYAKGNINIGNTSWMLGHGTATITINGTGNQTFTGNGVAGNGTLPNIIINKSSGTLSLASIISIDGNWTYTAGTVNPGSSTLHVEGDKTISGSHTLNNVCLSGNSNYTYIIASGTILTVSGSLTTDGIYPVTINTGTIYAQGDIGIVSTTWWIAGGGGTATIVINGTGNQSWTGSGSAGQGKLPNIEINKSSGTLSLSNILSVVGNWTYTAGTINPGSSTVYFIGTKTITGSHTLANVTFNGDAAYTYTIASGNTLTATGTLAIDGANAVTINTGTINAQGDVLVMNTATTATGTASLVINGTGNQSVTGSGTAGQGRLPKITINKSSGTLSLNSIISVYGDWIYTTGTVNPGTSTVALLGTSNLDGQEAGTSNTMSFYKLIIGANTRTLTGNLDVNSVLTISSGATLTAGSYSINAWTWNGQGTWNYNTSTVTFDGSGYAIIKSASGTSANFYDVKFNRSSGSIALQNSVIVNHSMTLIKGHVKTTSTKLLAFVDNATISGASDSAYVHGPVRKAGNDVFIFPLGDTTLADNSAYHPLAITAPSSTSDQFEATYFAQNQTIGDSLVDTLASISNCEYWTLKENTGSSNVKATLGWNRNSCNVDEYDDLRVAGWDGYKWVDEGQGAMTINTNSGTIQSTLDIDFSIHSTWPITLSKVPNEQPYAILKKKIDAGYYSVTNGKLMFKFDEEYNDPDAKLTFKIFNDSYQEVGSSTTVAPGYEPVIYIGSNYYLLNVLNCNVMPAGVLPSGYFILEIINDKNEHWYLRFKHTATITINCDENPEE